MSELTVLKGKYAAIMKAVQNAIIPRGGAFELGAPDYDLLPDTDDILQSYDPRTRFLVTVILNYIQYNSIIHKGRLFTNLSETDAADYLESLEMSRFYYRRGMVMFLKLLTVLPFFSIDETLSQIGYSVECH